MTVVTKCHTWGGLEKREIILSQFWKLEVQNQGVGRVSGLSEGSRGVSFLASS